MAHAPGSAIATREIETVALSRRARLAAAIYAPDREDRAGDRARQHGEQADEKGKIAAGALEAAHVGDLGDQPAAEQAGAETERTADDDAEDGGDDRDDDVRALRAGSWSQVRVVPDVRRSSRMQTTPIAIWPAANSNDWMVGTKSGVTST